jgi:hypothetical protein
MSSEIQPQISQIFADFFATKTPRHKEIRHGFTLIYTVISSYLCQRGHGEDGRQKTGGRIQETGD